MASPTTWAHLPNAPHIDWVLRSLLAHPEQWGAARDAARGAAWDAALDAALDAARGAARGAVAALIAWDHAGTVLTMDDEAFGGALALDPHMVLLAPARAVFKWETKEKK
jgi:hypothetical protein